MQEIEQFEIVLTPHLNAGLIDKSKKIACPKTMVSEHY